MLNTDSQNAPITIPAIDSFSIGLGYGNFIAGADEEGNTVFKEGFNVIIGFKVRTLSFNLGN